FPPVHAPTPPARPKAEAKADGDAEEEGESKRAGDEEGKVPHAEVETKAAPHPSKDVVRQKVYHRGLLMALGRAQTQGRGLGRPPSAEAGNRRAGGLSGVAGSPLATAGGSDGLSTRGTGKGGGGTGLGQIHGTGDLDLGSGRGRRGHGPGLGARKEREVA